MPRCNGGSITSRVAVIALAVSANATTADALGAQAAKPVVPTGFTITKLAAAPRGATNCDDLAILESHLFVGCQNAAQSSGGGGNSTLVEYGLDGTVLKTWSIKDKIDGVGSDPLHHRLIVTLNEDANSHLATIVPSVPAAQQITNYRYTPDPRGASTPPALRTGGGTDHVSVDSSGEIFLTGSHAGTKTGTAVFKVALSPPSGPSGPGTATLTPTFADNASATTAKTGAPVKLALGDVDSGTIVPQSSPRFGGSYVITDQTALELVFAGNLRTGTGLKVLKTPFGLDDLRWTTSDGGTLYVVDKGSGTVGHSALYKVTGPFAKNTVLASNDGQGDQVVKVNLTTGALAPFVRGLGATKGLVYVDPSGSETQLPLAGSAAVPVSGSGTPAASKSGSDNTALVVAIIVAAVLLLGAGGYAFTRRRGSPGTRSAPP